MGQAHSSDSDDSPEYPVEDSEVYGGDQVGEQDYSMTNQERPSTSSQAIRGMAYRSNWDREKDGDVEMRPEEPGSGATGSTNGFNDSDKPKGER